MLRFAKYAYEIAYVNALFLLVFSIVFVPLLLGIILFPDLLSAFLMKGMTLVTQNHLTVVNDETIRSQQSTGI